MKNIVFLLLVFFLNGCAYGKGPGVCFNSVCVKVSRVSTKVEMAKGLSGHRPLKKDEGMLFSFEHEGYYAFWMYEMTFDLDILWINKDRRIVYIRESLKPCGTSCPKYTSLSKALYVLEVPAGFCQKHHLQLGDIAKI